MFVNKATIFIVMLIAVIIFCAMSLFYMKVSCTGMYESYRDTTKSIIDPAIDENDLPKGFRNTVCIRISPQEYWLKLTIAPELKQKLIIDFKDNKDYGYDDFYAVDVAFQNIGVIGLNRHTLINWVKGGGN